MAQNSKQNLITAISVIIALLAVVYALMQNVQKPYNMKNDEKSKAYAAGEENPVVIKIDGHDVTRMELVDNFNKSGSRLPKDANIEKVFPMIQEQYLVEMILNKGADDAGININNPQVASRISNVLNQSKRAVFIGNIGDTAVSDEKLQELYENLIVKAPDFNERRASHILVKDEKTANALIIKINNGSDFAKLAIKNSVGPTGKDGGDLGYFAPNEMVAEFAKSAFEMEIGKTSQKPVKTQFGYHIIKLVDERVRTKPTFEQVKPQLDQQLRQAEVGRKIKELRENMNITIFKINGDAVDVPPKEDAKPMADKQPVSE